MASSCGVVERVMCLVYLFLFFIILMAIVRDVHTVPVLVTCRLIKGQSFAGIIISA